MLLIAFVGKINRLAGDISVFLPPEQALLPQTIAARERNALYMFCTVRPPEERDE